MRTYTELDQLSDQTLDDIIDKYKYMLLNTRHTWHVARPFPQTKHFTVRGLTGKKDQKPVIETK